VLAMEEEAGFDIRVWWTWIFGVESGSGNGQWMMMDVAPASAAGAIVIQMWPPQFTAQHLSASLPNSLNACYYVNPTPELYNAEKTPKADCSQFGFISKKTQVIYRSGDGCMRDFPRRPPYHVLRFLRGNGGECVGKDSEEQRVGTRARSRAPRCRTSTVWTCD
jgi:hypothetical protein